MSSKRITWVDKVKGFGILMIMLAHVIQNFPEYNPLNTYVCSFHVPIFFIISGYVAAMTKRDSLSKKRVMALLIPYVIFSCFNTLIKFTVLGLQHALSVDIIKKEMSELLITGNGTVWFLMTLLLTEVVYVYILRKTYNIMSTKINITLAYAIISVVLIVVVFILPDATNPLLVVLYRVICAEGFYGLGYVFYSAEQREAVDDGNEERQTVELSTKKFAFIDNTGAIVSMLAAGLIIEKVFGCGIDFFNGSFTKPVSSVFASILTSFGWILLIRKCDRIERVLGKILNYMGTNSIIVMLVHPIVLMVILYPFGNLIRSFSGAMAIVVGMVLYIVLGLLQVPCIFIINNYLPFLVGRKK